MSKSERAKKNRLARLEHYRAKERERKRKQRAVDPERHRAYTREYRMKHPEKVQEWWKRTYAKNGHRLRERARVYRQEHKEEIASYLRDWRQRNPEKYESYTRGRRELQRGALISDFTDAQWRTMKKAYRGCCAYCGVPSEVLHRDHVVPLSAGGTHTAGNVVPACPSCNLRKHAGKAPPFAISQLVLS